MSSSNTAPAINRERGFLPSQDPLQRLPQHAFDAWEDVASALPKLFASDHLRRTLEQLPPFPLDALADDRERERAMLLLSYVGHAYVWCGGEDPPQQLPARIAIPWHAVATTLGRPPVLSYSSYALHNYRRFDPARAAVCGNVSLIQNFLGGLDEEWFILIHVDIEHHAGPALAAIHPAQDAAESSDGERLESLLAEVAASIGRMHTTLLRMPERCDPYVYYHRVRPYIHGWKNHPDLPRGLIYQGVDAYGGAPQQFRGETGAQSAIVPSLDALLGIGHEADALRTYLMEMRTYMPPDQRAFIASVETRFDAVRGFVQSASRRSLTEVYDACVAGMEKFRALHLEYAASYIFRQAQTDAKNPHAVGTGGTPFMSYLKKHRDETSQHKLDQRSPNSDNR